MLTLKICFVLLCSALYAASVFNPTTFEWDISSRTKFSFSTTNWENFESWTLLAIWLESWNHFMQATLFYHPKLLAQLIAYQTSMCHYASKYSIPHVLSYDARLTNFCMEMQHHHAIIATGTATMHLAAH